MQRIKIRIIGQDNCGDDMEHLCRLVDYAVAMRHRLEDVNVHSFNNFDLRVGISCGPLVGGVIGARKPVFDIWGNTVNEASRMDSTGVMGKIQVPHDIARVTIIIIIIIMVSLEKRSHFLTDGAIDY